jgi:pimeloyl-ACP methyl ester carboxylesterase
MAGDPEGRRPARSFRARRLRIGLSVSGGILVLWLAASWLIAYWLTRRAVHWFAEEVPAVSWGKLETHRLRTRDGEELGAWLVRGGADRPSVVLLHGNGSCRMGPAMVSRAELLAAQGCTVLMVSLRAHGDSTGEFNDFGFSARHDLVAAVDFLERLRPGRPIIIQGLSMGSAAATFAAGELAHRVQGYILECPYQDLRATLWYQLNDKLPPVLDRIAYLGLATVGPLVLPDLARTSPRDAIAGIPADVPVLILAGAEDRIARPEDARALHRRVEGHGTLIVFERAGHWTILKTDPGRYRRSIVDFLRTAPRHDDRVRSS